VIIGAGAAGITAGTKLLESGHDNLIILEAENRIGGRIHSIPYSTGIIDLGAQWVHGQEGNIVYESFKDYFDFNVEDYTHFPGTYLLSNGSLADQKAAHKLDELAFEILFSEHMKHCNASVGEYFDEKYAEILSKPDYEGIDPALAEMIKEKAHEKVNSIHASESWYDVGASINGMMEQYHGNSDVTWRDKGYATVFDLITVSIILVLYLNCNNFPYRKRSQIHQSSSILSAKFS
jgi:spermine oxidase